jgi:metal-responsive CopG/Arc/MetJ family transcriptional regulator
MKTSVSIPDSVFEQAERVAKKLKLSRSALYTLAIKEYISNRRSRQITARLDEVYGRERSNVEPVFLSTQATILNREEW